VRTGRSSDDIVDLLGCKLEEIIHASENWFRCRKYIGSDYERIPPPKEIDEPLQALIFDITIHSVN
jgi:GTP-binding protein LepA